jgi:hypothetical protein
VSIQKEARLHEKTVQEIARSTLPKVQGQHTTRSSTVAQRVSITLVDDLDGSPADETVQFGLDGTNYEIDLSEQNAKELRTRLEDFQAVARKVSGRKKAAPRKSGVSSKQIRDWAREQGMEVSARGVVPVDVVKAYEAAH